MSNELRAALNTAWQAATAVVLVFLAAAAGFVNGENPDLVDDIDTAWKALAVIGIGVVGAVVTFIGNKVKARFGLNTPTYTVKAKDADAG